MSKKNIIIVGYPKSGTTWFSRLVAELVSCPLQGDWGFEELDAPYKEGLERKSEFQVYKSHHTFNEIEKVSKLDIYKIIYIIRDPRDVVISGIHYFSFLPKLLAEKNVEINNILKITYNAIVSKKEKKRQMIEAILNGNTTINSWFKNSWSSHYLSYKNKDVLILKYEDMLKYSDLESHKILNYLGIEKDDEHIKNSIKNQSFQKRKQLDKNKKDTHQKKILRKGKIGEWKKDFTEKEKNLFKNKLKDLNTPYDF
jgi:hypothetical protein